MIDRIALMLTEDPDIFIENSSGIESLIRLMSAKFYKMYSSYEIYIKEQKRIELIKNRIEQLEDIISNRGTYLDIINSCKKDLDNIKNANHYCKQCKEAFENTIKIDDTAVCPNCTEPVINISNHTSLVYKKIKMNMCDKIKTDLDSLYNDFGVGESEESEKASEKQAYDKATGTLAKDPVLATIGRNIRGVKLGRRTIEDTLELRIKNKIKWLNGLSTSILRLRKEESSSALNIDAFINRLKSIVEEIMKYYNEANKLNIGDAVRSEIKQLNDDKINKMLFVIKQLIK